MRVEGEHGRDDTCTGRGGDQRRQHRLMPTMDSVEDADGNGPTLVAGLPVGW
jgi:hypothetical protein